MDAKFDDVANVFAIEDVAFVVFFVFAIRERF